MNEEKTIKDLSVVELKAFGFDQIAAMNQAEYSLKVINQELASRNQPPVEPTADGEVTGTEEVTEEVKEDNKDK